MMPFQLSVSENKEIFGFFNTQSQPLNTKLKRKSFKLAYDFLAGSFYLHKKTPELFKKVQVFF